MAGGGGEPPFADPHPPRPPPPAAGQPEHRCAVAHPTAGDTKS